MAQQKEEQAQNLLDEARDLVAQLKADEAFKPAQQALGLFRELADQAGAAEALRPLLLAQIARGDLRPEEALKEVKEQAGQVKRSSRDGRRAEALMQMAQADVHLAKAEPIKALKLATEAQAYFHREEDWSQFADAVLSVVAPAQLARGDGKKALHAANLVLDVAQKVKDPEVEARAWSLVAAGRFASKGEDAAEASTKALELFKRLGSKIREAAVHRNLAEGQLGLKDAQAALAAARESLTVAKSADSWEQVGAAAEFIVEAHLLAGHPQDALKEAEEQLAFLNQSNADKHRHKGISSAMSAVVVATAALKGVDSGLETVKRSVEKLRADGNKYGEVRMLHKLATMSPFPDYSMNTAQAALALAQSVGDALEEKAIKRSLTSLYVAKGKVDKAPNRRDALLLLQDLTAALEKKDGDAFDDANKDLDGYWDALKQSDIEAAMRKVVSKDPTSYMEFLKEHGAHTAQPESQKQAGSAPNKLLSGPREYLYFNFRASGISYGPRYRCCTDPYAEGVNPLGAVGVLKLQEDSADWEQELRYNPSILDCCLQNGGAVMFNQYR
eukprot:TRINITY_DN25055_c0_g1_i1.p1 TRINITY_DN25055_c0_g1~~TRINITY_DN25055_c0_g1_i1.p1  ORF type:complete len:581 (+),score=164.06 TRINITY_DN25055_c0_g1_i1:67-1743(+)